MTDIEKAHDFAEKKHAGQKRRTGGDYIAHPRRVARIVEEEIAQEPIGKEEKEQWIAAAFLHDTLEDTKTTVQEIDDLFGPAVAALVVELTNDPDLVSRLGKKICLADKMEKMSAGALTVKLADRLDNLRDTASEDPERVTGKCDETSYLLDRVSRRPDLTACQKRLMEQIQKQMNSLYRTYR